MVSLKIYQAAAGRDVPLAKNPSMGTAQQRLFLVLKVVLHAVVVISEVLRLSTKSRCSCCCRHISSCRSSGWKQLVMGITRRGKSCSAHRVYAYGPKVAAAPMTTVYKISPYWCKDR